MSLYRVTLRFSGVDPAAGPEAARDIAQEFRDHRTWHGQVSCVFADGALTLVSTNDFDRDGSAIADEFSDCLAAFVATDDIKDGSAVEVVSVEHVDG